MNTLLEYLNSFGSVFVEFSWAMLLQSGLLIAAVLVIDLLVKKKVRAVFRYCIWMLVLVKLVLPPSLASPVSVGYFVGDTLPTISEVKPALPEQTAQEQNAVKKEIELQTRPSLSQQLDASGNEMRSAEWPRLFEEVEVEPIASSGTQEVQPAAAVSLSWEGAVFTGWLLAVGVMCLLVLQRVYFVLSLIRQAKGGNDLMMENLEYCRKRLNLKTKVRLKVSPNATSPAVCGLFRPVILVPQNLTPNLGTSQLRTVLLHELAHIKRGDLWVNLVQTLLQIVYFYNPLLWLANAMIRRVREQAVDETVQAAMGEKAREYPDTLLNVARLAFKRPALSLRLIGVVESRSALKTRIKRMLTRPIPKSAKLGITGLILIVVTGGLLLPMAKASKPGLTIKGTVTDAETGQPIAGARVGDNGYAEDNQWTTTDSEGNYSYKTWYEEHNITAEAKGYKTGKQIIITRLLRTEEGKIIDFTLEPISVVTIEQVMKQADHEARFLNHEYIGTEHILLALASEKSGTVSKIFKKSGIGKDKVRNEVLRLIKKGNAPVTKDSLPLTPRAESVIKNANQWAQALNSSTVKSNHVLLGLLQVEDGVGAQILISNGLSLEKAQKSITSDMTGEDSEFTARLSNGVTVELVGLCEHPSDGKQWWRPDGILTKKSFAKLNSPNIEPLGDRYGINMFLKYTGADVREIGFKWKSDDGWADATWPIPEHNLRGVLLQAPLGVKQVDISLGLASGDWKDAADCGVHGGGRHLAGLPEASVVFHPPYRKAGKTCIDVTYGRKDFDLRLLAVDKTGQKHQNVDRVGGIADKFVSFRFVFNLPIEQIESFILQRRPYQWVTFKNVSLKPGLETDVQVMVENSFGLNVINDNEQKQRYFVTIIVGSNRDKIGYQGQQITWEELKDKLNNLPNKEKTVLEVAYEPGLIPGGSNSYELNQWLEDNEAFKKAGQLVEEFGLEYLSFVGPDHPSTRRGPVSIRTEGKFNLDEEMRVGLRSFEEEPLLDIQTVEFNKSYNPRERNQNNLNATLKFVTTTFPPKVWEIGVRLLNEQGHQIDSVVKPYDNLAIAYGRPLQKVGEMELNFGETEIKAVDRFEVKLRELIGPKTIDKPVSGGSGEESAVQVEGEGLSFGPVVETIINDNVSVGNNSNIDFDTGRLFPRPENWRQFSEDDWQQWIKKTGVDASGATRQTVRGLMCDEMIITPLNNSAWETYPGKSLASVNLWEDGVAGRPGYMTAQGEVPVTYAYKTREGGIGILQILGFKENPSGVNIRYKMVQQPSEPVSSGAGEQTDVQVEVLTDKPAIALDLDTSKKIELESQWPDNYEIAWDNDAGGSLFTRNRSVWMWPLLGVNDLEEAVTVASKRIDAASEGGIRGFPAKENKYVLIKTSEGNFAVLEIQEYDETKASIRWQILEQTPNAQLQDNKAIDDSLPVIQAADLGAGGFADRRVELSYDDGRSDGRNSIAGSGHGVIFDAPSDGYALKTVRILGSRYGADRPPDEDFHIYVCDENFEVIEDLPFAYSRFAKGEPRWVTLRVEPVEVPSTFIICADFNPERTKGVYVHYDSSASGNSLTGLPGSEVEPFNEGEWMIRVTLEKSDGGAEPTGMGPATAVTGEAEGLQELIQSARPGETIMVPAGTYTKPLYIDKSLKLKGQSQSASIIEVTADIPAIMIDTKGKGRVTIEDVTIKWQLATSDKTEYPFAVGVKDTRAEIRNCAFYPLGNPQRSPVAVNALGFSNLTISGCQFEGFEYVICYREGTEGAVQDCLVTNCGHQGVMSYAGSTVRVERNIITGSKYHAVRTTGGTMFINDNLLIENANRGVYLGNKSGKGTISNNLIMKNGTGIDGFAGSSFKIENNVVLDNNYAGIGMRNTTSLSIRNNILMGNPRGLVLFEPDGSSQNKIGINTYWNNEVDAENVTKTPDSIDAEPGFANPENGDFSLKDGPVKEQKQGLTNPQIIKQLWNKWKGLADESEMPPPTGSRDVQQAEQAYIVEFVPSGSFRPRTAKELLDALNEAVNFRFTTHHFRTKVERGKLRGYILVNSEAEQKALKIIMDRIDNLMFVEGKAARVDELARHYAMGQPGLDDEPGWKNPDYSSVVVRGAYGFENIVVGQPTTTLKFVRSRLGPDGELTETKSGSKLDYKQLGLGFWFDKGNILQEIHLNKGFRGKLATGISLDSTMQGVFSTYGGPLSVRKADDLHGLSGNQILFEKTDSQSGERISRILYRQHGLIFWFKGESINQIVLFSPGK